MMHALEKIKKEPIKYWVLYMILIGSLISNLCEMEKQGIHPGNYFIRMSSPAVGQALTDEDESSFWKNYGYQFTQIRWEEPLSIIVNAIPYLKFSHLFSDYFEQNEVTFDTSGLPEEKQGPKVDFSEELPTAKEVEVPLEKYKDYYYVLKNFMTGDGSLGLDIDILKEWNFYELMKKKITIDEHIEGPKVLIFHTHAREKYMGGQSVVDIGEGLKQVLENKYGIEVMHVTEEFYATDNTSGGVDGSEYERMEPRIREILEANPSIQVVMDLHRDGISDNVRLVTDINGKQTAQVMFVNGLCLNRNLAGEVVHKEGLKNPYLADNLAFSMQAAAMGHEYYPGLLRKIYCKEYRYSTHMCPNSLLVEIGAQTNTGEEAMNAVEPLADILAKVLKKD